MTPFLLALLFASPDTVAAPRWQAGLRYGFEAFTRDRATWQAASIQLGRRFARGTVIGEALTETRFDRTDWGGAVDTYLRLRPRSYGNLRVQVDPGADVLPRLDVSAEVFQSVGGGVELSLGYRRMQYPHTAANLFVAGIAKYVGNWYLRARTTVVPKAGTTGVSGSLGARVYLATADDYLDVQGGLGQELITLGAGTGGPDVQIRSNRYVAARLQKLLTARIGLSVGASYHGTDGLPDRRGVTVGLFQRW